MNNFPVVKYFEKNSQEKTVAVYGDSYAREPSFSSKAIPFGDEFESRLKGLWIVDPIISDKYRVTNFAVQGSDFLYSYELFKKSHFNFDKVIFIVTFAHRVRLDIDGENVFIHNPDDLELLITNYRRRSNVTNEQINRVESIINSLKAFYVYVKNNEIYEAGLEFLVNQIKEIRPDAIIEYAFLTQFSKTNFCLNDVSFLDNKFLPGNRSDYVCCRPAHMSIENNKIFANYIRRRLDGEDVQITINDFVEPSDSSIIDFFIKFEDFKK